MRMDQTPDLSGRTIGGYEILRKLGAGGMGVVYLARDPKLGRDVAFKVLPDEVASDPERLSRFRREAKLLATLSHPQIGAIHGFVEDGTTVALVLELLDGDTVGALLARGPMRLTSALTIAIQIADALDHVHRRGITHRDLKPSNIMLTKTGAKLLDFGVGKWSAAAEDRPPGFSTETADGAFIGTLNYMAPEQLEGREAGPRSDLFAFGAVLYEMLTGRRAFDGQSRASIVAAVLHTDPPPASTAGAVADPGAPRSGDPQMPYEGSRRPLAECARPRGRAALDRRRESRHSNDAGGRAAVRPALGPRRGVADRDRGSGMGVAGRAAAGDACVATGGRSIRRASAAERDDGPPRFPYLDRWPRARLSKQI